MDSCVEFDPDDLWPLLRVV